MGNAKFTQLDVTPQNNLVYDSRVLSYYKHALIVLISFRCIETFDYALPEIVDSELRRYNLVSLTREIKATYHS